MLPSDNLRLLLWTPGAHPSGSDGMPATDATAEMQLKESHKIVAPMIKDFINTFLVELSIKTNNVSNNYRCKYREYIIMLDGIVFF